MKKTHLFLLFLFILNISYTQTDRRLKGLDKEIKELLEISHAAGFSVVVVEKDEVLLAKGYGYRDYEQKIPADANTLFAIGSSTKAFTSALLGQLREDEELSFVEKPSKYLPELQFYNEELNSNVDIKDLMCHRTGLPRHDLSWYFFPSDSKDSLIRRVQFMEPFTGVRQQWYYNNFMYLALGLITEHITGKSWEDNIREKIFTPLGMDRSVVSLNELKNKENVSYGYELNKEGQIEKMDYYPIGGMSPAGSIFSSANDLSKWLITWINKGKYKDKQIIPESYINEAITAQMVMGGGLPDPEFPDMSFSAYGYGWMIHSYSGHYRVSHGGNIDGFSAEVAFFPSDSLGIAILVNQNGSGLNGVVRNIIADRMLQIDDHDWMDKFREQIKGMKENREKVAENKDAGKIKGTKPSHILLDYTGNYENPGYGKFNIELVNDSLVAHFKRIDLWLKHVHYDVFEPYLIDENGRIDTTGASFLKFNFVANESGDISYLSSKIEPTLDPIDFKRTPVSIDISTEDLEKYTGDYNLMGTNIKIYIKDEALYLYVAGQPEYELISNGKHKFSFKTLEGFKVEFKENEEGNINEALLIQPHGNYMITKK